MAGQLADDLAPVPRPPTRSRCSRRGRRCRSSGSARASRRWAGASRCCGGCATPSACPAVIVAGVRALLQRLGPGADRRRADHRPPRRRSSTPTSSSRALVEFGYRREELVEHRGEFARRGAIIDVFPSTADAPIRIDLWGDEVDRLTTFGVNDQRSIGDLDEVADLPGPRADRRPTTCGRGPPSWSATEPWGREQWERLAEGALFDGMESWLPWLVDDEHAAHRRAARRRAKVVLVEPRRMRDRAADLLAEEDDLARALASHVGARRRPAVPPPARRARPPARRGATRSGRSTRRRSRPTRRSSQASGLGPGRRRRRRARRPADRAARRRATASSSPPTATARPTAWPRCCSTTASTCRSHRGDAGDLTRPGGHVVVAPLHRGVTLPGGQAGDRRRERPHRPPPRPPPAAAAPARRRRRSSRTSSPATTSSTTSTASAATSGMVKRAIGGVERDYLLLAYKGGDKLYVPSDQIDTRAPVRRRRGARRCTASAAATSPRPRAGSARRSREIAQELVVLYQKRVNADGPRLRPATRRGSARWRTPSRTSRRPTSARPSTTSRPTWSGRTRWTAWCAATSASARPRSPSGPRSRRSRTASRSPCSCPTTLLAQQHGNTFADRFAGYPIRVEVLSAASSPRRRPREVVDGLAYRRGRLRHRHPPPARRATSSSRTSACSSSTRSSASACSTRRR